MSQQLFKVSAGMRRLRWPVAACDRLSTNVHDALKPLTLDWALQELEIAAVNMADAENLAGSAWREILDSDHQGSGIYLLDRQGAAGQVAGVFEREAMHAAISPIQQSIFRALLTDLATLLLTAFSRPVANLSAMLSDAAQLPSSHFRAWSGAIVLSLRYSMLDQSLANTIMITHDVVAKLLPPPTKSLDTSASPMVSMDDAISSIKVGLGLRLSEMDIELGTLASLSIGDVLVLSHLIDQPAWVVAPDPENPSSVSPLCQAALGEKAGKLAMEFVRFKK